MPAISCMLSCIASLLLMLRLPAWLRFSCVIGQPVITDAARLADSCRSFRHAEEADRLARPADEADADAARHDITPHWWLASPAAWASHAISWLQAASATAAVLSLRLRGLPAADVRRHKDSWNSWPAAEMCRCHYIAADTWPIELILATADNSPLHELQLMHYWPLTTDLGCITSLGWWAELMGHDAVGWRLGQYFARPAELMQAGCRGCSQMARLRLPAAAADILFSGCFTLYTARWYWPGWLSCFRAMAGAISAFGCLRHARLRITWLQYFATYW